MSGENFNLVIVTPEKQVVDGQVTYMSAPGVVGEFGVLAGHTEFFTTLRPGQIRYDDETGEHFLAVSWGYAEVKADSVIILADSAEMAEDIDLARAISDKESIEKELSTVASDDTKYPKILAKLEKVKARISAVERLTGK